MTSKRFVSFFPGADANGLLQGLNEDFAVTDTP
jgi:hypothetical protein